MNYVIALDQGTTSSRSIVFDETGHVAATAQIPFAQIYPQAGWVEHDPLTILDTQLRSLGDAFRRSGIAASEIAGIGVTNQRETTIVWERSTGRPVYNAIVWQCRRTAETCDELKRAGFDKEVWEKTGLVMDAYFSGTKLRWILDNVPGARQRAERGELLFGTIESWLIWNLTGGKVHVTDHSNASRTMLFDIDTLRWDETLCGALEIPMAMLPEPVPCSAVYGYIAPGIPGLEELAGVPICGAAGDQQAALLGQGCVEPGRAKNTYGTGCFTLMNIGERSVRSENRLVTSVAWTADGKTQYALEGSVFNAGSTIQWLRDELGIISTASECDTLAESVESNDGVYLVSAFTGLGAPWWDMYARGTIVGLTRGTSRAHLARAALEGIAYQVADLLDAMERDAERELDVLRVDGGASVSRFLMQFQADLLDRPIDRPKQTETTAWGAAFLAGHAAGLWPELSQVEKLRESDVVFTPQMPRARAESLRTEWRRAVERAGAWASPKNVTRL
ncbi:MAG: glycerol kinase GlpK [Eubacteriales bacterium]|nr:glycerol kinase GlpK [Eubacteriales bacterium]